MNPRVSNSVISSNIIYKSTSMNTSSHLSPFLSVAAAPTVGIPQIPADMVSTVVQIVDYPLTFGGGHDIGSAAVTIAANRLLAAGATPRYASAGVTIDTDTPIGILNEIASGMQNAAVQAEMEWAACNSGFTASGPSSGVAMSVFALGELRTDFAESSANIGAGDAIIVTAPVGTFGTAIAAARRGDNTPVAGAAGRPMLDAINEMFNVNPEIRYMALAENGFNAVMADLRRNHPIEVDVAKVAVDPAVSELAAKIGVDPLDQACSSAMVVVVKGSDAEKTLEALRRMDGGAQAAIVGRVTE